MTIGASETSLSLKGKVALVTGGGTGIGKSIALEYAKAGADVAVSGRRTGPLEEVVQEIVSLGQRGLAVPTDVSKKVEVDNLIETVNRDLGEIDILVNNAASSGVGPSMLESDEERWDEIINTDLKSVYLCCHAVAPTMIKRKTGNIINISSVASFRDPRGARIYSIAKAGVNRMTLGLSLDMAPHNVRVNCIAPGTIQTDMLAESAESSAGFMDQVTALVPLGRVGEPIDVATMALFLASDAANYITAQIISIDAGLGLKV